MNIAQLSAARSEGDLPVLSWTPQCEEGRRGGGVYPRIDNLGDRGEFQPDDRSVGRRWVCSRPLSVLGYSTPDFRLM